ncbi:glutamate-1-semialdehyde 2,1-aminomutase [Sulfobacillus thermosulfidooxidans DSM 9293]|uniref:Glutamate-1-semialdehyde 2,1-aminomutase n=1 Tax=Sulfobacillus thermosulfidooxidans (strain DSM 9293 / VKM B-1269 / AT-1) TaxID=929705 RepID=A0A1W1W784_SULTA|nr:glutamate-1-semialdehyde 2,1-aminomutase [Sulfobacillus thermosulfidooxidans]SMC02146.1 glutamate-1-semialdehyde 2,1-aminomutase [Sulfobacillus thermosulfidooxidans DSM 9293]
MESYWQRAQNVLPGGVNSPVRSFKGVGGEPFFVKRGQGPYLFDDQGRQYIDFVMSYGPLILGHAHPKVVAAVSEQATQGLSYGAPTDLEVEMAETLVQAVPGLEMVRMVNSGTEATMAAIRVARGVTGRDRILKFAGSYHGHGDSLLVKAGSGAATMGVPDSLGVPKALAELTLTVPYNDVDALRTVFNAVGDQIAAVIMEPVAGNMGTVLPQPGFLDTVRQLTRQYGALWIVDEVMTGFRVAWGGASRLFGLEPDLVCLAKVIGAGMPVGAYGGKKSYMQEVAPLGPVYQAGTLSGNPVAMAAGLAQLHEIHQPDFYSQLEQKTRTLAEELVARGRAHGIAVSANTIGGMFTLFFSDMPPRNFDEVSHSDHARYRKFFHGMLEQGVFFPPSPFETAFPSWAHTEATIQATLEAADRVFQQL